MRAPLLLTGGPAVGKTATSVRLASGRGRAAAIDVDDVRQFVVAGHAAPWQGGEGQEQQRLGVENASDLTRRFLDAGIEVVLADVVDDRTLPLYRRRLPGLVVVRLRVAFAEAERRAGLRPVHLTAAEFADLHRREARLDLPVDHVVDTTAMTLDGQVAAVERLWS